MFYVNADKCAINEEEVREMQIQRHSRTAEAVIRRCSQVNVPLQLTVQERPVVL
jgi:predicted Ser/Thr protein kinase